MCKHREETRITEKADINGGIQPQPLLLCMACPIGTIWWITFAPVSPGAPRPPSAPDRPCKVKHRIPLRHHILCTTVHCFMQYSWSKMHINIETVIAQFIFMMRLIKWIRLELWSLIHWFSYTACEMFSLTLFPGFPLRPAGPGNPRGPWKEKNKNQTERWF